MTEIHVNCSIEGLAVEIMATDRNCWIFSLIFQQTLYLISSVTVF